MATWINITELLDWHGNLTGIQRIEYNLAKLYLESDQDAHFFVYLEEGRTFKEVTFKPEEIVKLGIANNSPGYKQDAIRISRLIRKIRGKIKNSKQKLKDTIFSRKDTVLVIGSIWTGNFAEDLVQAKNTDGFKLVHFSFDMIPSVLPGFVVDWLPDVFVEYHKSVFSHADAIISISESTAKDVKKFLQEHSIKNKPIIKVVRIGEGIETSEGKSVKDLKPGFLLSVSTIESRKNHTALFYMLQEARRRGVELPKIVIVGRNGWHTEDFRYIAEHDQIARDGIMIINDADDATLAWLYHNCLFTVFPSFYEGWGMPIAESLAYGKLCLSSDTSSMPEIAGDLIDYFSPYDTSALLEKVIKYLDARNLTVKETKIRQEYKPTSWNDTYQQVVKLINSIEK